ncbi:long-chain-fatty-acid--CoA ligase [Kineococcus terrestris]|uniref:long-chain-fatty-acid--CoA ligase n=1 Tax=Kineococcus terrestris TaxID=2044856 RepID=UPI0034DACF19
MSHAPSPTSPPPVSLAQFVPRHAAERPDAPAVRLDDAVLTWAAFDDATARAAGLLRAHGVEPGDRVAVSLPNVPQFCVLYYGALRAGAVVVPLNPLLQAREVAHCFADAGVRLALVWRATADAAHAGAVGVDTRVLVVDPEQDPGEDLLAGAEPLRDVHLPDPEDTAVVLYTSGTTGAPKGAELSHRNLLTNALTSQETLIRLQPGETVLGALPLFHAFGQTCALNTAVVAGAAITLLPRFDPAAAFAAVERDRVRCFAGVPTMYGALLHHPGAERADVSSLRLCVSGGASLPVELLHAFEARFGCTVLEGYGLSETSPVASFNHPDAERRPGSIGTPVRGCEMDLRAADGSPAAPGEVGEVVVRGENVMKGYWGNPAATALAVDADGWFRTGDLATRDADGYYRIVDRAKDMINRGGMNVYPREVEEVLYEHPAVAEAAVVAVPDERLGEEVGAAVVLKPGASATPQELQAHVKAVLAAYKYPRHVWLQESLPKGATGKILKREIRAPRPSTTGEHA